MSKKPWLKQPGESEKSYEAFCIYRDMGAGRSLEKAWVAYASKNDLKVSYVSSHLKKWSVKYHWVERCEQWAAYQDRVRLEEREEAIRASERKLADKLTDLVDKAIAKALDGDTKLLCDLMDRGGLKAPDQITHDVSDDLRATLKDIYGS